MNNMKKPPRINKSPVNSVMRRIVEQLATNGPMSAKQLMRALPDLTYDILKRNLARAEAKGALSVVRPSYPYMYVAAPDCREVLDAIVKPDPVKPFKAPEFIKHPPRLPKQHHLQAVWGCYA